ncbi:hypothetical protein NMG60_11032788 [Bertholletia excelsa]
MTVTVEMRVHMDCGGCESKVRKALQKLKGVDSIDIDMAMQKVTVTGSIDQKKALKTVRKTGRRAELWQFPYSREMIHNSNHAIVDQHYCSSGRFNYHEPRPSSSYNYYKHGYEYGHGYSHGYPHSSFPGNHTAGSAFSDENPHACSIM